MNSKPIQGNTMNKELWLELANKLHALQAKRKELEKEETIVSEQLKELSNHESCEIDGVSYTLSLRSGNVDYSRIPQLLGVDLTPYRKAPVKSWKLLVA